ncbi:MAG: hypothetical protein ABJO01_09405 [Parasphingorhabdus sp.]|uniref:hypothetical protein n=1 Tax=Parasphingorhabdus sp. TaxID=2709688 RepID=UPI003298C9AD
MFITSLSIFAMAADTQNIAALDHQLPGIYTNEEHSYFEKDAGRTPPAWIGLKIEKQKDQLVITRIDDFGKSIARPLQAAVSAHKIRDNLTVDGCSRNFDRVESGWVYSALQNKKACKQDYQIIAVNAAGLKLRFSDGTETSLKRSRPVQCWAAAKKNQPKADGSPDWHFAQKLDLHDQGGRVLVGGGESGADPLVLRMRSVYWPAPSTNRPSMVLYVHRPDAPDRAVSYSWADINASRVGLNLRWMQASCTIKGAERPSQVNPKNFRG